MGWNTILKVFGYPSQYEVRDRPEITSLIHFHGFNVKSCLKMDKNVNNNDKAFAVGVSINKLGYPKPYLYGVPFGFFF